MNTLELKPGEKIGVFVYNDKRGSKARIDEIEKISPTGQVTLKSGKRYTSKGKEIVSGGDPTYLCSVEEATAVIEKAEERKKQKEEERIAYLASPEGKRKTACIEAVSALIKVLNQHGWYTDEHGHMDVMESEIEQIVRKYVNEHEYIE
ncbi:MAG: hypothetical protein HC836_44300 [Richelia sp. RM2_1_2]|nr:hypothetical protein [Richelia sp. RM2_1_2]